MEGGSDQDGVQNSDRGDRVENRLGHGGIDILPYVLVVVLCDRETGSWKGRRGNTDQPDGRGGVTQRDA